MSGIRAKNGLEGVCIIGYLLPHYFLRGSVRVGVYGTCESVIVGQDSFCLWSWFEQIH